MIYLDTSLIVSALVVEDASSQIVTWLLEQSQGSLNVSEWSLTEVASALAFKLRTGQIDETMRSEALAVWSSMRTSKVVVLPVPPSAFLEAADYFDDGTIKLRGADALHLAIAQIGGHSLATLDKAMAAAAHDLGIIVEDLGEG